MTSYVDSHCHLDRQEDLKKATSFKEYVAAKKFPPGFEGCISVFCDPVSFDDTNRRFWGHFVSPDFCGDESLVHFTAGIHPHVADKYDDELEQLIDASMAHPACVAWGECGLDYFRLSSPADVQKQCFVRQLKRAMHFNKPVVIHARDADADALAILKDTLPNDWKIHLHCFTAGADFARELLAWNANLRFGLTGVLTFKSARDLQTTVREIIPAERIILETDAPYMAPLSRRGKEANGGDIIEIAAKVAELKGITVEQVLHFARENTRFIYGF